MNPRKPNQNFTIYLHVIIAIALLPAYTKLGESFKYLAAPYVFYLVWSEKPQYYPALIIQMATGSTISLMVLLLCLIKTVLNYKKLKQITGSWLIWLAFLPAPYMFYLTFIRYFEMDLGLIGSFVPLAYYLSLFPFFYGILLSRNFNDFIFKAMIISLFLLFFISRFGILGLIRINTFSIVLLLVIGLITIMPFKISFHIDKVTKYLGLFTIISFFMTSSGEKFHITLSVLLAFGVLYLYLRRNKFLLNNLVKPRIFIVLAVVAILIINSTYNYKGATDASDFSYNKIEDFPSYIMFKALGDRGPIWYGVWHSVLDEKIYFPPLKVVGIDYLAVSGGLVEDSDIPAHNIVLELLRNYGLIFGFLFSGIYILMIIKFANVFRLKNQNPYVLLLSSVVFGIAIVVGMTGQFVLMPDFSLLLMGMAGICMGYSYHRQNSII